MLLGHYEILGWLDPLHIVGKLKQAPGDALFQKISLDVIFLKNKFSDPFYANACNMNDES